jgi:hypothetical protein
MEMPSLDDDWTCEQDDFECGCFAVWQSCDECLASVPEMDGVDAGTYLGGLVPKGEGLAIACERWNLWFHVDTECGGAIGRLYDICPHCTGSGGGYACGVHDLSLPRLV